MKNLQCTWVSAYILYTKETETKKISESSFISTGIGEDSLGKLKSIAKRFGRDVEIIELKDTSKYFDYWHTGLYI